MSRAIVEISALNDLDVVVGPLETVSSAGVKTAVTTGTVTGFLATSASPSATAADAALQANLTYIGGANGYKAGEWLFQLDAAVLTAALLSTHFAAARPYLIVTQTNAVRIAIPCTYNASRYATVEEPE